MDDTGDPSENGQTDVDQQVSATSALQEDTQRGEDDGEDDLADVTVEVSILKLDATRRECPSPSVTYEGVKAILRDVWRGKKKKGGRGRD